MKIAKRIGITLIYWCNYFSKSYRRSSRRIMTPSQTIDYIIQNKCSVSRFGCGEFRLISAYLTVGEKGGNLGFQNYNEDLGRRLFEVLQMKESNLSVGLPGPMFGHYLRELKKDARRFWRDQSLNYIDWVCDYTDPKNVYTDAYFTRFYADYKNHDRCGGYVRDLKKIWKDRRLLIVEGEQSRLGVGNDLFEEADSIERILAPSTDAFSKVDEIKDAIRLHAKNDTLVLLALGPTATVIAGEMSSENIQIIDIGHVDIEYEWMLRGLDMKTPVKGKFVNEVSGYTESVERDFLQSFAKQIIRHIK